MQIVFLVLCILLIIAEIIMALFGERDKNLDLDLY